MRARGVGLAHIGQRRETNEDCWLADDQLGLYAVADGVGGARGGEIAAATAITALGEAIREQRQLLEQIAQGEVPPKRLGFVVEAACQAASQAVFERSRDSGNSKGMGCTLTCVLTQGGWAVMGHVGDSRLYVCRSGDVQQLSDDHSFAAELARQGAISAEQARRHPHRNVLTRCVGRTAAVQADVLRLQLVPEDRLLLCSDGLSNYLDDPAWLASELSEEDLEGIPTELVNHANRAGGADNITALVVAIDAEPETHVEANGAVQNQLSALEGSPLFSGLSLARKTRILSHCTTHEVPAGPVLNSGDPLPGLQVVVSGQLLLQASDGSTRELGPGGSFGGSAILGPRPSPRALHAATAARLLCLSADGFRTLVRARPRLGALVLRRLALSQAELLAKLEADV